MLGSEFKPPHKMFIYEKSTQHGLTLRKLIGSYEVIHNLED